MYMNALGYTARMNKKGDASSLSKKFFISKVSQDQILRITWDEEGSRRLNKKIKVNPGKPL